ncbi:MAG: hypothetical protein ACLR8P_18410 [Clostridium fessum]
MFEIEAFYSRFIGMEQPPKSLMRWLHLPEDKLAAVVGGAVFGGWTGRIFCDPRGDPEVLSGGCPDQEDRGAGSENGAVGTV